eukprot:849906-Prorocentrum_lima.AAC.1
MAWPFWMASTFALLYPQRRNRWRPHFERVADQWRLYLARILRLCDKVVNVNMLGPGNVISFDAGLVTF